MCGGTIVGVGVLKRIMLLLYTCTSVAVQEHAFLINSVLALIDDVPMQ